MPITTESRHLPLSNQVSHVLIIEDSETQALFARDLCRSLGVNEITVAHNGREGLANIRQNPPDLILLDLEMPEVDGVQVLQQMAQEQLILPVIVTSAKDYMLISTVELMGRELGLPVLGGLKKPLAQSDLQDLLARLNRSAKYSTGLSAQPFDSSDIRLALDEKQFIPYYQPKVTLQGNLLKGAEMLARWQHPQHGIVSPAQFIPIIEKNGWATELTLYMLEEGLMQWQEWARRGLRLPLSVNLSALSLQGHELIPEIEERVRSNHVPPRFIIFEITETALSENLAEAIGIAARLRLAGFGLSIDDFGTGFATMQQLTRFPFTELKIDQSLVTSVANKPHITAILSSVIELSHRMQLTTVAEGIESDSDLGFMGKQGCMMGQGFYIARPMEVDQFEVWMKERIQTSKPTHQQIN